MQKKYNYYFPTISNK